MTTVACCGYKVSDSYNWILRTAVTRLALLHFYVNIFHLNDLAENWNRLIQVCPKLTIWLFMYVGSCPSKLCAFEQGVRVEHEKNTGEYPNTGLFFHIICKHKLQWKISCCFLICKPPTHFDFNRHHGARGDNVPLFCLVDVTALRSASS